MHSVSPSFSLDLFIQEEGRADESSREADGRKFTQTIGRKVYANALVARLTGRPFRCAIQTKSDKRPPDARFSRFWASAIHLLLVTASADYSLHSAIRRSRSSSAGDSRPPPSRPNCRSSTIRTCPSRTFPISHRFRCLVPTSRVKCPSCCCRSRYSCNKHGDLLTFVLSYFFTPLLFEDLPLEKRKRPGVGGRRWADGRSLEWCGINRIVRRRIGLSSGRIRALDGQLKATTVFFLLIRTTNHLVEWNDRNRVVRYEWARNQLI